MNGSVNNREAGDLIRHRAHYDVTVMYYHNAVVACLAQYICSSQDHEDDVS